MKPFETGDDTLYQNNREKRYQIYNLMLEKRYLINIKSGEFRGAQLPKQKRTPLSELNRYTTQKKLLGEQVGANGCKAKMDDVKMRRGPAKQALEAPDSAIWMLALFCRSPVYFYGNAPKDDNGALRMR
ncbi:hypothetical protein JTE90_015203 [Oedothorax gibbosus]|uniref:Uncharacterized protein n=1 Tax=Oedothorax gibbosus TaxID=931172 RepID=A0AAV6V789_9ARAC|nr:hypothetical protein JTE90_015203 [Oedothorax gibbosus]